MEPVDWSKELDALKAREAFAEEMGGPEKVARQRARGKLTARERITELVDTNSFREIGKTAGAATYDEECALTHLSPSNFIFGQACLDKRPAIVSADDFTVRGGASDAAIYRKFTQCEKMAHTLGLPLIRMIDGTGGGGSVKSLEAMGRTYVPMVPGWEDVVKNLDSVPVVALGLGPTAGLGAARVVASHYSIMVKGLSQIFTAGPPVVAALGEDHDKETLGGSDIHTRNGVVDEEATSEAHAFELARTFLSYLPSKVGEPAPRYEDNDPLARLDESLLSIVPRDPAAVYSMRPVLEAVFDKESVFEMGRRWGRGVHTCFARLGGRVVAVLASDPSSFGGAWTADTARKAERFIGLAQKFDLPVINFVDNPGFRVGLEAERAATIRYGVEAMNAIYRSTVPWASIITRRAYGVAAAAMSDASKFQFRAAWPSGDWGSLPMAGGIEVAYQSELRASDDPKSELAKITKRLEALASPFRTADAFLIEDIIDPRETRAFLGDFIRAVRP